MAKPALGKGLGALISAPTVGGVARPPVLSQPAPGDVVQRVALELIVPSPLQPRKEFVKEQLAELMDSIREHGIIQPLIVRRVAGKLELIAGERRFRASRELGLKEVPVISREASDKDVLEMALIENLQREDLNPIEEARAYQRLAESEGMSQADIARMVDKSRSHVANLMRLRNLPLPVHDWLTAGEITMGHARALLGAEPRALTATRIAGLAAGVGMVATTRWIAPHPKSAANLAYIERVWEPPIAGGEARSVVLGPIGFAADPSQLPRQGWELYRP